MQFDQEKTLSTQVVTQPGKDDYRPLMAIADDPNRIHEYTTNFDKTGRDAVQFITQAMARPSARIDEMGDRVFHCKYYLAHVAEFVGDAGEVTSMPRLILIGKDGEVLSFVSEGGIKSMDLIISLLGRGPWEPPLPLSVVAVRTRRGFKTYRIVLGEIKNASLEKKIHTERSQQKGQVDNH